MKQQRRQQSRLWIGFVVDSSSQPTCFGGCALQTLAEIGAACIIGNKLY